MSTIRRRLPIPVLVLFEMMPTFGASEFRRINKNVSLQSRLETEILEQMPDDVLFPARTMCKPRPAAVARTEGKYEYEYRTMSRNGAPGFVTHDAC